MKVSLPGRSPDFVGFGVHRSGSTWLNAQLRQHPNLWTPPPGFKEVHYFDEVHVRQHRRWHETRLPGLVSLMQQCLEGEPSAENLERARRLAELATSDRDDDWYRAVFGLAGPDAQRVGEITPAYSLLDVDGVSHLARVNPDVRVFIVFRDPAERIWSQLKLQLKKKIEKDPTVLEDTELLARMASKKGVVDRTRYRRALETLEQVFAPEQILVTFFDKVADAPVELLTEVSEHIGVDPGGFPLDGVEQRRHASPPGDIPDWFRSACAKSHRADVEWLAERFGSYPAAWLERS